MHTTEEIKTKLKTFGIVEDASNGIIEDVMNLISAAVLRSYVSKLNPEQKIKLKSLSESEVTKYLEDNKKNFPPMPQEEFERIYQETWNSYFDTINN